MDAPVMKHDKIHIQAYPARVKAKEIWILLPILLMLKNYFWDTKQWTFPCKYHGPEVSPPLYYEYSTIYTIYKCSKKRQI